VWKEVTGEERRKSKKQNDERLEENEEGKAEAE